MFLPRRCIVYKEYNSLSRAKKKSPEIIRLCTHPRSFFFFPSQLLVSLTVPDPLIKLEAIRPEGRSVYMRHAVKSADKYNNMYVYPVLCPL